MGTVVERHVHTSVAADDRLPADFERHDPRFACTGDSFVQRVFTGARKTEGPAYFPAGRYLMWSDIPDDRLLRWDETTGVVGVFRSPSGYANGNTIDRRGRLITCEQGARRVTRTEPDGSITVLADQYEGRRLNSPNDVVERADGTIWFTDPSYGIDDDYEGDRAPSELGGCFVFRLDPSSGALDVVADDFVRPNGLAFSPDERQLYVVDTRQEPSHVRRFDVTERGELRGGDVFCTCDAGRFDGIRFDDDGCLWAAAWDGVHCFAPDGALLGKLVLPEPAANLTFGGRKRNDLFVAAGTSIYAIRLTASGARYPR